MAAWACWRERSCEHVCHINTCTFRPTGRGASASWCVPPSLVPLGDVQPVPTLVQSSAQGTAFLLELLGIWRAWPGSPHPSGPLLWAGRHSPSTDNAVPWLQVMSAHSIPAVGLRGDRAGAAAAEGLCRRPGLCPCSLQPSGPQGRTHPYPRAAGLAPRGRRERGDARRVPRRQ